MSYRSITPWPKLTRTGVPAFVVCRVPLLANGQELPVGTPVTDSVITNRIRLRQLYEQRRIAPVVMPFAAKPIQQTKQPVVAATASLAFPVPDVSVPLDEVGDAPIIPYIPPRGESRRGEVR